jgi:hypothetical protein
MYASPLVRSSKGLLRLDAPLHRYRLRPEHRPRQDSPRVLSSLSSASRELVYFPRPPQGRSGPFTRWEGCRSPGQGPLATLPVVDVVIIVTWRYRLGVTSYDRWQLAPQPSPLAPYTGDQFHHRIIISTAINSLRITFPSRPTQTHLLRLQVLLRVHPARLAEVHPRVQRPIPQRLLDPQQLHQETTPKTFSTANRSVVKI